MTSVAHSTVYVPQAAAWLALVALYFVVVLVVAHTSTGASGPGGQPSPAPNRTPNACQVAHRACP